MCISPSHAIWENVVVPATPPVQNISETVEDSYSAICDKCRSKLTVGSNWYHKPGTADLCFEHWKELPDLDKGAYTTVREPNLLGEESVYYKEEARDDVTRVFTNSAPTLSRQFNRTVRSPFHHTNSAPTQQAPDVQLKGNALEQLDGVNWPDLEGEED